MPLQRGNSPSPPLRRRVYRLKSASLTDKSGNRSLYRREGTSGTMTREEALEEIPSLPGGEGPWHPFPSRLPGGAAGPVNGCSTALSLTLPQAPSGFDKATTVFWNPKTGGG